MNDPARAAVRKPPKRTYAVWDSETRRVQTYNAVSPYDAGRQFALNNRTPFNVTLRVVPWDDVQHIGIRLDSA